ncbi:hypothetical protein ACWOEF_03510 [Enterococcus crotali]
MKLKKGVLFCMALVAVLFASVAYSSKSEAAESFDLDKGATFTFDSAGNWKNIYSGVFESQKIGDYTSYQYVDYSGQVQYVEATADSRNIQAAYVVKDRIFDFVGTYSPSESYFSEFTKIWTYRVNQVNGLAPVYITTVSIEQGALGTTLSVKADRSIVPNWSALPNVENMSKVMIYPGRLSLKVKN